MLSRIANPRQEGIEGVVTDCKSAPTGIEVVVTDCKSAPTGIEGIVKNCKSAPTGNLIRRIGRPSVNMLLFKQQTTNNKQQTTNNKQQTTYNNS